MTKDEAQARARELLANLFGTLCSDESHIGYAHESRAECFDCIALTIATALEAGSAERNSLREQLAEARIAAKRDTREEVWEKAIDAVDHCCISHAELCDCTGAIAADLRAARDAELAGEGE